jgi:hypothetical protein
LDGSILELTIRDRMRVMSEVPQVTEVPVFMFQMYPMFQKYLFLYEIPLDEKGGK